MTSGAKNGGVPLKTVSLSSFLHIIDTPKSLQDKNYSLNK